MNVCNYDCVTCYTCLNFVVHVTIRMLLDIFSLFRRALYVKNCYMYSKMIRMRVYVLIPIQIE